MKNVDISEYVLQTSEYGVPNDRRRAVSSV